jgi:hypothetical protein
MIMKKTKIFIVSALGVGLLGSQSIAKNMASPDLSNMIIQGENRLQVHPVMTKLDWKPEVYKDVTGLLQNNVVLKDIKPPTFDRPPLLLIEKVQSNKTASPWLTNIFESPVVTLKIKTATIVKKAEYTFLVKDSNGKNFFSIRKKGELPEEIRWKGFSDKGEPLQVGFDYTYAFSTIDEAGNPQRMAGKPFKLDAFRYDRGATQVNSFFPEALFDERSSLKLSKTGYNYLTEVKDYIRSNYDKKIEIIVYDEDDKFGASRAQAIGAYFIRVLDFPENKISTQGLRLVNGGHYRHVDIVVK